MIIFLTTVDTKDKVREMARKLVELRLAACVSIIPNRIDILLERRAVCGGPRVSPRHKNG